MINMKNNRNDILKSIEKADDKLTVAKLLDRWGFTSKTNRPALSDFLDPRQQKLVDSVLKSMGLVGYRKYI